MFFTKPGFFLIVLPAIALVYWMLVRRKPSHGVDFLLAVSLAMYAYSSPTYLPLMVGLIVLNFLLASAIGRAASIGTRKILLALAISVDLAVLGYYKCRGASFGGVPTAAMDLPLGVSFFIITLVVYAHQSFQSSCAGSLRNLSLVVSYFPHLAAGPILNYGDVDKQLDHKSSCDVRTNISRGILLFAIGLAKKLLLADSIAPYSDFVFHYASSGSVSLIYAWLGAWAFVLELYFDFSGYTDMACGISLLFGIRLPVNFNSPLKAATYVEVWNRWHMSLTRVLRELVFRPLGGMKKSMLRRNAALVATMAIGGIWHGASLNYFLFGLFSGIALSINHWFRQRFRWHRNPTALKTAIARVLTLATITATSVLFRAQDGKTIVSLFYGMAGSTGILTSTVIGDPARYVPETILLRAMGLALPRFLMLTIALTLLVMFARNSNQLTEAGHSNAVAWRPTLAWGLFSGFLLALGLASISHTQRFLYVNF